MQTPELISIHDKLLLTVDEAAALTGLHPMTIRKRIWNGEIPARRIGRRVRISREALREWAASSKEVEAES